MKQWAEIIKSVSLLTQFGFSLLTPLLLCLGWIFIPGFFFGLGGSGMVAYKLYLSETHRQKEKKKKEKVFFNRHS